MDNLPAEIIIDILGWCLSDRRSALDALSVCRDWHDCCLLILHRDLRFGSQEQMELFLEHCSKLQTSPRSVSISLAGASIRPQSQIFRTIANVWLKCRTEKLDHISLCLNSHSLDPYPFLIGQAMASIDPLCFQWSGPDPPHHWSTAIVSTATEQLCLGISRWARLRVLHLSHIAFPKADTESVFGNALLQYPHPDLRCICLSQAVFVSAPEVARIALGLECLELFHLVDCYIDSIWGSRLRLGDVERSAQTEESLNRLRAIVKCEAKLERIMGGDRGS